MGVKTKSRPLPTSRLSTILEDSSDTSESLRKHPQLEATKRNASPRWSKMSFAHLQSEFLKQLNDARQENAEAERRLQSELNQAKSQLDQAKTELNQTKTELNQAKSERNQAIKDKNDAQLQMATMLDLLGYMARRIKKHELPKAASKAASKEASEAGSPMSEGSSTVDDREATLDRMDVDEILRMHNL